MARRMWLVASRSLRPLVCSSSRFNATRSIRCFSSNESKIMTDDNAHKSNAEYLINKYPIIEIDGPVAVCDGGGGALGHPVETIQLDCTMEPGKPQACMYCGLRYVMKPHHH